MMKGSDTRLRHSEQFQSHGVLKAEQACRSHSVCTLVRCINVCEWRRDSSRITLTFASSIRLGWVLNMNEER